VEQDTEFGAYAFVGGLEGEWWCVGLRKWHAREAVEDEMAMEVLDGTSVA